MVVVVNASPQFVHLPVVQRTMNVAAPLGVMAYQLEVEMVVAAGVLVVSVGEI